MVLIQHWLVETDEGASGLCAHCHEDLTPIAGLRRPLPTGMVFELLSRYGRIAVPLDEMLEVRDGQRCPDDDAQVILDCRLPWVGLLRGVREGRA